MNEKNVLLSAESAECVVCGSRNVLVLLEIPHVPVFCNLLWRDRDKALKAPRGDIRLGFCSDCGHIFNLAFDPGLMRYTQDYENSLHFSSRFQEYAESLAESLVDRHGLRDKDIIEIGCGKGDFLSMLCELGGNRGVGFDPSYESERDGAVPSERVKVIQEYYSEDFSGHKADFICCRHVLEHIQHPREFLASLRRTIGERPDVVVFFEIPNVMYTLRDLGIWDLIYEHCSYFCASSLSRLFGSCGFDPRSPTESFGGQYLCIEAFAREAPEKNKEDRARLMEGLTDIAGAFADKYRNKVSDHRRKLDKMRASGEKGVIWGGGSKGVTFLNTLGIEKEIEYVVDINPHKKGKYVPGTGQKIVPPEFLKGYDPDLVLVMNPLYLAEIGKTLKSLDLAARLETV